MSKVSLQQEDKRKEAVLGAIRNIESEIQEKLKGKKKIVIKPDLTSSQKQTASTHSDSLKALLIFLSEHTNSEVTIAGSAKIGSTKKAFNNFGFYNLKKSFNINFVDLYEEDCEEIEIYSRDLNPVKTSIPKIIMESDFLISLSGLKTDDSVIASMGIKNLSGVLVERPLNHDGYKAINLSIANLMEHASPDLSIIDAFEAIEGEGPINGDIVRIKAALAGLDFLSVDTIGAHLMDFNPYKIGYLSHCRERNLGEGEISKISIVGNTDIDKIKRSFRPHSKYEKQLAWE